MISDICLIFTGYLTLLCGKLFVYFRSWHNVVEEIDTASHTFASHRSKKSTKSAVKS